MSTAAASSRSFTTPTVRIATATDCDDAKVDSDEDLVLFDDVQHEVQLPQLNTTLQPEFVHAERQEALLLPKYLSENELLQVLGVAGSMSGFESCCGEAGLERSAFEHDVTFSASHGALNLHRNGCFATALPALMEKIVQGMRSQPGHWCDPATCMALNVRCVEFHSYREGDGLMTDGHKDYGSVLSMSVLLSHPRGFGGGQLMTWQDGARVVHAMGRGDALLFPSLKTHGRARRRRLPPPSLPPLPRRCPFWTSPARRVGRALQTRHAICRLARPPEGSSDWRHRIIPQLVLHIAQCKKESRQHP